MSEEKFMEYDPYLSFWDQPRLLRGLLTILGVSAVMIWVEVIFHRFILLPEGNAAVKNPLRCLHKDLPKPIDEMTEEELNEYFSSAEISDGAAFGSMRSLSGSIGSDRALLTGLYNLENEKLARGNNNAYISMFIPWLIIVFLMMRIRTKLHRLEYKTHVLELFGGFTATGVALSIVLSVLLFMGFQIVFYFFGQEFEYATGDELQAELENKARSYLFTYSIPPVIKSIVEGLFGNGPSSSYFQYKERSLVDGNYEYLAPKIIYLGGSLVNPASWKFENMRYPQPIDPTLPHFNPSKESDLEQLADQIVASDLGWETSSIGYKVLTEKNEIMEKLRGTPWERDKQSSLLAGDDPNYCHEIILVSPDRNVFSYKSPVSLKEGYETLDDLLEQEPMIRVQFRGDPYPLLVTPVDEAEISDICVERTDSGGYDLSKLKEISIKGGQYSAYSGVKTFDQLTEKMGRSQKDATTVTFVEAGMIQICNSMEAKNNPEKVGVSTNESTYNPGLFDPTRGLRYGENLAFGGILEREGIFPLCDGRACDAPYYADFTSEQISNAREFYTKVIDVFKD